MKSFFKKAQHGLSRAEGGAKTFFSKDTANKVDGVLQKVQNTLPKIANGITKAGNIAGMVAPALAGVPLVGVPLSAGAASFSTMAPNIAKGLNHASRITKGTRAELSRPMNAIQKAKPEPQEDSEMFGNLFA